MYSTSNQGFNPPWDIVLDSIGIEFDPQMTPGDINLIMRYSYFQFKILQKMQWEGKLEAYPAGMGISGATSQNAQSQWNSGDPNPNARKRFGRFGKYLGPQTMWCWESELPRQRRPSRGWSSHHSDSLLLGNRRLCPLLPVRPARSPRHLTGRPRDGGRAAPATRGLQGLFFGLWEGGEAHVYQFRRADWPWRETAHVVSSSRFGRFLRPGCGLYGGFTCGAGLS